MKRKLRLGMVLLAFTPAPVAIGQAAGLSRLRQEIPIAPREAASGMAMELDGTDQAPGR
jgi:hypothetical protein